MITLTNGFPQGPNGLIVPNGSITLQLNVDATVVAAPYGFVAADLVVVFQFDGTGRLIQPAKIWSNAELNPQNSVGLGTYYLVTFYDQNGARLNKSPMWWQFPEAANATVDISEMAPYATVGGNVIFYPTIVALTIPPPGLLTLGGVFANPGTSGAYISAINTDGTVSLTPFSSALVAAGATTDVQINSGGALYADSGFTYTPGTGVAVTDALTIGTTLTADGFITIGTTHAAVSGALRLENNQFIAWRNAMNNADLTAGYNANDIFVVGNLDAGNINAASFLSTGAITYYGINQTQDDTYVVTSAANAIGATTTYTGTFSNSGGLVFAGGIVKIAGFSNSSNNGFFYVVSTNGGSTPTTVTVNNSGGTSESASATLQTWAFYSARSGSPGAIQVLGAQTGTVTINSVASPVSILVAPIVGQLGLVLGRENDPMDMTALDTFLTDQNNRGFQITAITDGLGSTTYTLQMGLVGGVAGAFFNCVLNAPTLIESATHTPSSASDTGTTGQIAWDASFIYVCTATNTWKRVGIATW